MDSQGFSTETSPDVGPPVTLFGTILDYYSSPPCHVQQGVTNVLVGRCHNESDVLISLDPEVTPVAVKDVCRLQ
jgi:hypothetical protein